MWLALFLGAIVGSPAADPVLLPVGAKDIEKLGDQAVFTTLANELWITDGTVQGTQLLSADAEFSSELISTGDQVFAFARSPGIGVELFRTDGTPSGTRLVKDIYPGLGSGLLTSGPSRELTSVRLGRTLIFIAEVPDFGSELWISDGTEAGTKMLKDIAVGSASSEARGMYVHEGFVYFSAWTPTAGHELWRTNGTSFGTKLVKDIARGEGGSFPDNMIGVGSRLFFVAGTLESGVELWTTTGSAASTKLVKDLLPGPEWSWPTPLVAVEDKLWFVATDGSEFTLWESGGTPQSTVKLDRPDFIDKGWRESVKLGGSVLVAGLEDLWISNGSSGTFTAINPGLAMGDSLDPHRLQVFDGHAYFASRALNLGWELWMTDGKNSGTRVLHDFLPDHQSSNNPTNLGRMLLVGTKLLFTTGPDGAGRLASIDLEDLPDPWDSWALGHGVHIDPEQMVIPGGRASIISYGFGFDPNLPGSSFLPKFDNWGERMPRGLPRFELLDVGDARVFRIEYLRRRLAGLSYRAQVSAELREEAFEETTAVPEVIEIDAAWDRIRIDHPLPPSTDRFFGRVEVTLDELRHDSDANSDH